MTFATTFINRPFNDVVKESPLIVRGRAADQYTDWGKGGSSKAIFTYTQFIITEVLKGDLKETSILLRQPGGEKDGVELHVPGAAIFNRDEELVVLLGAFDAADKSYDVPGLTTGKYNIVEKNGEQYVESSLGAGEVYDPKKDPGTQSYNSRIPLEVFRKVAKGVEVTNAPTNQFEQSKEQSKEELAEKISEKKQNLAAKESDSKDVRSTAPLVNSEKNSIWIPIAFSFVAVIGGLTLYKMLAKGESK